MERLLWFLEKLPLCGFGGKPREPDHDFWGSREFIQRDSVGLINTLIVEGRVLHHPSSPEMIFSANDKQWFPTSFFFGWCMHYILDPRHFGSLYVPSSAPSKETATRAERASDFYRKTRTQGELIETRKKTRGLTDRRAMRIGV